MTVGSAAAVKHARHAKEPALVAAGRAAAAAAALLRHFAAVGALGGESSAFGGTKLAFDPAPAAASPGF